MTPLGTLWWWQEEGPAGRGRRCWNPEKCPRLTGGQRCIQVQIEGAMSWSPHFRQQGYPTVSLPFCWAGPSIPVPMCEARVGLPGLCHRTAWPWAGGWLHHAGHAPALPRSLPLPSAPRPQRSQPCLFWWILVLISSCSCSRCCLPYFFPISKSRDRPSSHRHIRDLRDSGYVTQEGKSQDRCTV